MILLKVKSYLIYLKEFLIHTYNINLKYQQTPQHNWLRNIVAKFKIKPLLKASSLDVHCSEFNAYEILMLFVGNSVHRGNSDLFALSRIKESVKY